MRKNHCFMLIVLSMLFIISCSQQDSIITANEQPSREVGNLLAYYPFNGNANDESGNGNDGTIIGATLTTDRFGNPNSAFFFDGFDDYIIVDDSNILDIGQQDLSINLWIRAGKKQFNESDGNGNGLICKRNTFWANGAGYTLGFNEFNEGCDIVASLGDGSSTKKRIDGITCTYDGKWHQISAVFKRDDYCQLYVDGQIDGPAFDISSQQGSIANTMDLIIGAYFNGSTVKFYYEGCIDDIRVYNYAISSSEISNLYDYYDPDKILAYYTFDGNAHDSSTNHYDGELFGGYDFVEDRLCNEEGAIYFNGIDAYGNFGSDLTIDGDFTVQYFAKFPDLIENGYGFYALSKHKEHSNFSGGWAVTSHANGLIEFGAYGQGINPVKTNPGIITEEERWYHFVYTFNDCSDQFNIYLDNQLIYTVTIDANIFDNDFPFLMASVLESGGNPGYFAQIVLDDVIIYNYVLSQQEISDAFFSSGWPDIICGDETEGSLNINPSNSVENRFEMTTPQGLIDIDVLGEEGSNYTYQGSATEIKIKVKGQGKTLIINGEEYELSTDYRYTFTGEFEVYLYNVKPGKKWSQAKGHWWIDIEGVAESIDPEIEL